MDSKIFNIDYSKQKTHYLALFSDLHLEADDCDIEACKADFDEAMKYNARININGDLVDLILPSDRKRYTRGNDRFNLDSQLNYITEYAYNFLKPYVNNIDSISPGNHEESVLKYHHYDILRGVITLLNMVRDKKLSPIHQGGYKGFLRYSFSHGNNGRVRNLTIFRHHGSGGSSAVTKGMIDFSRVIPYYNADIYWLGHKHTSITDNGIQQARLDKNGDIVIDKKLALFTAGYKKAVSQRDYSDGHILDYSDKFYGLQAQGYGLIEIKALTDLVFHRIR